MTLSPRAQAMLATYQAYKQAHPKSFEEKAAVDVGHDPWQKAVTAGSMVIYYCPACRMGKVQMRDDGRFGVLPVAKDIELWQKHPLAFPSVCPAKKYKE